MPSTPLNRRQFLGLAGGTGLGVVGLSTIGPQLLGQAAPPKPGTPILRIAALGDVGAGDKNQRAVGEAMFRYHQRDRLARVLLLGDNIYNQGEIEKVGEAFEKPYAELLKQNVPFSACLGNHDIRSANGEGQLRYSRYGIKGRYYSFEDNGVAFFVLDTNSNTDWVKQLSWLERSLQASKAKWKIAYGHHPIYSSGHYGNSPEFIRTLTPLFKRYGVALYLNGHEHHYERSKPIDGTTYLVAGIGGASLRKVVRSEQTAFADSLFGFSTVSIYGDRIEIQGINTKNQVFDRGVIRPIG
jgi:predicted MPP superfamily phosphohydrolase